MWINKQKKIFLRNFPANLCAWTYLSRSNSKGKAGAKNYARDKTIGKLNSKFQNLVDLNQWYTRKKFRSKKGICLAEKHPAADFGKPVNITTGILQTGGLRSAFEQNIYLI